MRKAAIQVVRASALTGGPDHSPDVRKRLATLVNIVAVRTQSQKKRTVGDIKAVRDEAAKISCALAYV